MFGFFNKEKKERKLLAEAIQHCWKQLRRDHDILPPRQEQALRVSIQKAQNVLTAGGPDISGVTDKLVEAYQKCFPEKKSTFWQENGEVLLVAIVIAAAVQAYFFKPFKIPTGSMQPTLNGITTRPLTDQDRSWWYRAISFPIFGERLYHYQAEESGPFHSLLPIKRGILTLGGKRSFNNLLPTDAVEFQVGQAKYQLPMSLSQFHDSFPFLREGLMFQKGDVILDHAVQTGDQLFVERVTYHFRKPRRGDVFVFDTGDLAVSNPGEYYIKRLAGVPGDKLQIRDPDLWINGAKITEPEGFRRVMSLKDGYQGYSNEGGKHLTIFEDSYTCGTDEYFALGDNSRKSSDSRAWGIVPYHDIIGRALFVHWPFTHRFGLVD